MKKNAFCRCAVIFGCICLALLLFASCKTQISEDDLQAHFRDHFGEDLSAAARFYEIEEEAMSELRVYAPISFYWMGNRGKTPVVRFPVADSEGNIELVYFVNQVDGIYSSVTTLTAPLFEAMVNQGIDRAVFVENANETALYAVAGEVILKYTYVTGTVTYCDAEEAAPILRFVRQKGIAESVLTVDPVYTEWARDSLASARR